MSKQSKQSTKRRGRTPTVRNMVIAKLADLKRATAAELGTTSMYMSTLVQAGFAIVRDQAVSGQRGRPAYVYGLTNKGRGEARKIAHA